MTDREDRSNQAWVQAAVIGTDRSKSATMPRSILDENRATFTDTEPTEPR